MEEKRKYKITFWNVAELTNKDSSLWKGLEEWDIMVLSEIWLDRKGWEKLRGRLPKSYV